jgi:hypothetical protein
VRNRCLKAFLPSSFVCLLDEGRCHFFRRPLRRQCRPLSRPRSNSRHWCRRSTLSPPLRHHRLQGTASPSPTTRTRPCPCHFRPPRSSRSPETRSPMRLRRPPRPPSRSAAELLQRRGGRLPRAPRLSSPTPAVEPRADLQRLRFTRARTACPRHLRLRRVPPLFAALSPSGYHFPIPPSGGRESRAGSWSPAALGLASGGTSGTHPPPDPLLRRSGAGVLHLHTVEPPPAAVGGWRRGRIMARRHGRATVEVGVGVGVNDAPTTPHTAPYPLALAWASHSSTAPCWAYGLNSQRNKNLIFFLF